MEVKFGPNSVDEPNLLYKLQRKLKVFNTSNTLPNRGYNLVTSCSKYGLVFVASPVGTLAAYYLNQLIDKESEAPHLIVKLQEKPTYVAINCDQELLGVTGGQFLAIYKVTDFQNQNVSPSMGLKLESNPTTFVSSLQWNPCIPDSIAIAFYDGTLLACQVSTNQVKKIQSKCRCLCWSPKGKQFVTGNSDGSLTQYKPDLTPVKTVPVPNLFENAPVEAMAIYWISTYQFAVVFKNASDNSRPAVTILNTPKAGQPSCLNYEDICYSIGSNRPWYYYLQGLAPWNIILASSSNSMEMATLGSADGANWMQWCQTDESRPELPLTDKKQENYPVGICIDTCAIHQLPWGENETLPPMPILLLVSQTGLLTIFNIINLNKQAAQICSPPQQLTLPMAVMTTDIPDDVPPTVTQQVVPPQVVFQAATPQVIQPPAAIKTSAPTQPFQMAPQIPQPVQNSASQFGAASAVASKPMNLQPQITQVITPQVEQKQPVDVKPTPQVQPQLTIPNVPKPTIQSETAQPTPQMQEAYAAMKAEQDRIKTAKANQELKNMLIKEVNDFQMELYKFMVKTKQTQTKIQQDIEALNTNLSLPVADAEQLKKDCSLEDLRGAIIQLKLELVRMCAVVAEARTHAEAKDLQQWTQADPLTTKRVTSVKKLIYYVQNQVEQAQKALEHKWNEHAIKDPKSFKPGQYMTRPILDDVYQPLVKQQEILSRQQAVLRSLKNTLKEVDSVPTFKSTSLLRSTPFKNKDPLSKLTKNILNMSIEPQTKTKQPLLSAQKLDALRDMLSNHKTVKVKPVNVELREQLASMRLNYEKSLKERTAQEAAPQVKVELKLFTQEIKAPHVQAAPPVAPPAPVVKFEPKPDIIKQTPINVPSFTPMASSIKPTVPGLNNVARTLFTDEPKQEPVKVEIQPKPPQAVSLLAPKQQLGTYQPPTSQQPQPFAISTTVASSTNTRSVLKVLLQNKQANANAEPNAVASAKNDANTFMGQKICSPSAFSFAASTPATTASFTAKPISDINNMFSKFQSTSFTSESKQAINISQKSSETGEPDVSIINKVEPKSGPIPVSNTFSAETFMPLTTNKETTDTKEVSKTETKAAVKVVLKAPEKSKENVPENSNENIPQEPTNLPVESKEAETKPIITQSSINLSNVFSNATPSVFASANATVTSESQKLAEVKNNVEVEAPVKTPEKTDINETNAPQSVFAPALVSTSVESSSSPQSAPTSTTSIFGTAQPKPSNTPTDTSNPSIFGTGTVSSASSIFSAAVASQPKTTTQSGSIFSTSTSPTAASIFGSSAMGSIFGTTTTTTSSSLFSTTTASVFSSEAKPSVFSTTPTTTTTVFGATSQPALASSATSVFSSASTQPSIFASAATGSIFGSATTQSSVFGTSTATTNTFGTTSQTSVFGSAATTTTAASSVFGTATTQASVFGSPTTTTQSVFGTATVTTQASLFGTPTSQPSVFGAPTSSNQGSIFGSPSTQTSVFGTPPQSTETSVFGTPTQTTQASVFGTPTQTTQASVFGTPTQTTQSSVFGTLTQTTQASVFGTPTQTTQSSVFGTPPATTAQSGSLFGGAESNLFAAASISTTSAPSQSSGGSIFGSSPGSVFGNASGGNTNVFGGKSTFGQANPSAASIFGGGAAFGQKPATSFWSGGNTGTGTTGFGSGFGQQPSTQASSIFGGTSGGSFSTPSPAAQPFGSPQQTAFSGENKPSVFGSPQQQTAPAFGGSPVFGSKPVFGQPSGFGSPPASGFGSFGGFNKSPTGFGAPASFGGGASFGGTPAFGNTSPSTMFGGTSSGFGPPTQSNATFENLATQNTLTFGNLAQQSGQQPQAAPSFNTSPSFTGWRG
ncbi:unnamed protein product [Chilo suppressalis]|uniref:Nuclear pore complex protein Nup214 phenylalanine-glycine (FG) domain-containing protein n=1 Tax=Chilo suppressalis TaxID=168631 RepID=A0ABN8L3K8_CHISP|nr:unnamed protein product [Chilo suppressalis]